MRFFGMIMATLTLTAAQVPIRLAGNWQAKSGDEIRHIMVRTDSSAQFGQDVARWRVVGDSLWITLGDGVWQVYGMKLAGDKLPIAELQSLLPAIGIKLPTGSVIKSGTVTTDLTIVGPLQALVVNGAVEFANLRLSGLKLG